MTDIRFGCGRFLPAPTGTEDLAARVARLEEYLIQQSAAQEALYDALRSANDAADVSAAQLLSVSACIAEEDEEDTDHVDEDQQS